MILAVLIIALAPLSSYAQTERDRASIRFIRFIGEQHWTGLYKAAAQGNDKEVISLLDKAGNKEVDKPSDPSGFTALSCAIIGGHFSTVQLLIEKYGASLTTIDVKGSTPLQYAASSDNPEIVKYLVDKGVDINVVSPISNWAPIHYAVFFGHSETVAYLKSHNAKLDIVEHKMNFTPLELAHFLLNAMSDDHEVGLKLYYSMESYGVYNLKTLDQLGTDFAKSVEILKQ